jgi:hypothetical protein
MWLPGGLQNLPRTAFASAKLDQQCHAQHPELDADRYDNEND